MLPPSPFMPARVHQSIHQADSQHASLLHGRQMLTPGSMQGLLGPDKLRLVRWVLATNRSYIAPLAPSERFPELSSCL